MKYYNFNDLKDISENSDFIALITQEDQDKLQREELPKELPILPLKNTVLFPGIVIPITVGRDSSIKLIKDVLKGTRNIGVVTQRNKNTEAPSLSDLYDVGVIAKILQILKMPNGTTTVFIQGKKRFSVESLVNNTPYLVANVKEIQEISYKEKEDEEFKIIIESIKKIALEIIENSPSISAKAATGFKRIKNSNFLINFISSNLFISTKDKQSVLEINDIKERATKSLKYINKDLQKLLLHNNIQNKVRTDLNQQQKEYFLQQQIKTIQEELGQESVEDGIAEMTKRAKKKKWNVKTKEHFEKELNRFKRMNPQMAEYGIQRNYMELFLDLPWNTYSKDKIDIKKAEDILNKDHYGLEEVKKRILEYLAVLKLRNDMKSPIICLYGPAGVGKTSLVKSIANAIGRKYAKMSLGGLRDEAEIRGHRKTYIGATSGRIIQCIKKAGTSNPVFLLDEIDKLSSSSFNGDPSAAMLEVLDPEQNTEFYDNFLETDYDLSKVMFIATANSIADIPIPLRDRMEIIDITGYVAEEKIEIASKHLISKQIKEHGITPEDINFPKDIIRTIIESYTREFGVRGLEKQIAKCVRSVAKCIATGEPYEKNLNEETLTKILGAKKIQIDEYENNDVAGVVTGLAWTSVGGDILFIESIISEGKGTLTVSGNLGKVMKESATIAMEYIKANAGVLNISSEIFKKYNFHIHVPEGATPKDGPSAGITILTSLFSLITQKRVKRNIAMTGEITLRGKVLPVGGIKEKILAAKRAKIKEIILSSNNQKDVNEINQEYLEGIKFHYVKNMKEVLSTAITNEDVQNVKNLANNN